MKVINHPDSSEVNQEKVLFVEGEPEKSVIQEFFNKNKLNVRVDILGPSFHVSSVAEALHRHHSNYYFLIDRDHQSSESVELSWSNFPDPDKNNLLIWRKKEIENYFLDPDYIVLSQYLKKTRFSLPEKILRLFQERLFLDCANHVISLIRENQKQKWIEFFADPSHFRTKQESIEKLLSQPKFNEKIERVSKECSGSFIQELFEKQILEFSGNTDGKLSYGSGIWANLLNGKEVFSQLINTCFKVLDRNSQDLPPKEKQVEIMKDLVRHPLDKQPADFQLLYKLFAAFN